MSEADHSLAPPRLCGILPRKRMAIVLIPSRHVSLCSSTFSASQGPSFVLTLGWSRPSDGVNETSTEAATAVLLLGRAAPTGYWSMSSTLQLATTLRGSIVAAELSSCDLTPLRQDSHLTMKVPPTDIFPIYSLRRIDV